jgi:hypothetical protein
VPVIMAFVVWSNRWRAWGTFRMGFLQQLQRRLAWAVVCLFSLPQLTLAQATAPPINFDLQIRPIFQAHCDRCHGPTMRAGGVRLDQRSDVAAGGYSRSPLLGGTLKTNEIYRRIASSDDSYRMPKGQSALSAGEIAVIRRWVEAGTPWPEAMLPVPDPGNHWLSPEAWLTYGERWVKEVPGFIPWLCVMLVVQIGLLLVERYKQAVRLERPWVDSPQVRWLTPIRYFNFWHFLLLDVLMASVLFVQVHAGLLAKTKKLEESLADFRKALNPTTQQPMSNVYGNPPVPIRPKHAPRLSGVYYRGNCERDEKLFNGGNYRTATLRVSLVDPQGRAVNYGDRVPPEGLAIHFELERAPGTTDALFGDAIAKGVFLTKQLLPESLVLVKEPLERVQVTKPGWKWEATVPLKITPDAQATTVAGLIYVYQGAIDRDQARGTLHYGIQYNIRLKQLVIEPESEVWMGNLYWTPTLEDPHSGKIPLRQWFDDEPIPEITGPNSNDPKLLGIP